MTVLSSELRSALERAIVAARDAAEAASHVALDVLGVDAERVSDHLDENDRRLRVALRAEARQLGGFERLVEECAYEQWHRMMFARFLAENELLIHPEHEVPVSLADCEEIAHDRGLADTWVVASEFASAMLPGIFGTDDPALQLQLAPEGQRALEEILAGLPTEVFTSDDGLGWVYQYWQAKKKAAVDASGRKIGGADIAPVTQLFTEHYMVSFLLQNTLGAWWTARHPGSPLARAWEYLRFDDDGRPAGGSFSGWPETIAEVTVMDPCCGSGHFLVASFEMLRRMRMEAEGLGAAEAGDAVLRENLFGLELDPRCTQIAAFALALQAWKSGGYRELPIPNVACSGIAAAGRLEDWKKLAAGDGRLEASLERLHALFVDAADLGSLIDPLSETNGRLLEAEFNVVAPLLQSALFHESTGDPSAAVFGNAVVGAERAAALLARQYTLVVTNPPFLARGKQSAPLKAYCDQVHPKAKGDLATCFIERLLHFASFGGAVAMVAPQNWLFLGSYESLRTHLLDTTTWSSVALLGPAAFREMNWWAATTTNFVLVHTPPETDHQIMGIDVGDTRNTLEKSEWLRSRPVTTSSQSRQLGNPDSRFLLEPLDSSPLLREYAASLQGVSPADLPRFGRRFWEVVDFSAWTWWQSTVSETTLYGGRELILRWDDQFHDVVRQGSAYVRGEKAWKRRGVAVRQMRHLPSCLYTGEVFDTNSAVLLPTDERHLPAIWSFVQSSEFHTAVRRLDQKTNVTNATLVKVPFDLERWSAVAADAYPSGLPAPQSDDPTQWLFSGYPLGANARPQVAVARLVGYRWPRQTGSAFPDCPLLGLDGLEVFADDDGVVCMPSVRGERPAGERLRALLTAAFGEEWSPAREADLLTEVGYAGKSLELWLREGFFEQHCQLFHQRPFVWHVWDGRKDGFAALLNYHRTDRQTLEKLTYAYLGDWIRQQQAGVQGGAAGSEARLGAAQALQAKLQLILDGEPPYDIFVRWKPIEEQPLGWEPDLNDGVRLNIRPFVTAGVLRKNPKVNWNKDRGNDAKTAPWHRVFKGDRINDHHLTLAEKRTAREAVSRRSDA